jgi:hypothetical protein
MKNDEKKEGEGSFTVVDRRRFNDEGRAKEGVTPESSGDFTLVNGEGPATQTGNAAPEIDFGNFILSLATQALIQLGEAPAPPHVQIPKDFEAARQTIDIIDMLGKKTKGNLDENEAHLVESILHNLRISYVKAAGSK